MNFAGIAANAGTNVASIEQLIRHGSGSPGLAATIGTTPASITSFVNGQVSADIAAALGATPGAAQELRNMIGREGAIGLVIGLACGRGGKLPARPATAAAAAVSAPVDIPAEIAGEDAP
jgi:hypothetical protein